MSENEAVHGFEEGDEVWVEDGDGRRHPGVFVGDNESAGWFGGGPSAYVVHPEYVVAHVRCSCGNEFLTRATKPELHVEICSECHPFYTGKQKLVDTGGRVERFRRRQAKSSSTS